MSLLETKKNLIGILDDHANRVIALSGKWGTGKSHLWTEVRKTSIDKSVRDAVCVSLFGLSSLSDLRLKIAQGVVPKLKAGGQLAESIKSGYSGVRKVLKSIHSGFSAIDELVLIATPMMLKGRFIVIDDIERKHEKLHIDEILGFIDDCVQNLECRFLLILNNDQLSDNKLWEVFREKVIDQELRLDTSSSEAFDIALAITPTAFATHIKSAVEICKITNIRIICKIIRVINRLLSDRKHLPEEVLIRVIPSSVLLSAIHYKGMEDGPDFSFVLHYENSVAALLTSGDKKKRGEAENAEWKVQERWRILLEKLGIKGTDSFEALVVDYLKSGLLDLTLVAKIIDRYVAEGRALEAWNRRFDFFDKLFWHPEISELELLTHLHLIVPEAALHDMFSITALHDQAMKLPGGESVAKELIERWLVDFRARHAAGERGFDPDFNVFHQPLHPDIEREVLGLRATRNSQTNLPDVCKKIAEVHGWGAREANFLQSITPADYEREILAARGQDLKILLLQSIEFIKNRGAYQAHFGAGIDAFIAACRNILQREDLDARWKFFITTQFDDAGCADVLSPATDSDVAGESIPGQSTQNKLL
ncbi:NTPase KAP [Herbaspirillum rubrisubalbicans Os34]|uniref:NTPase KAP n=1 Tax=Herbaspirillum rubrisubalbicans Os34 TaxID=1235827 RepID=A0A6M3ZSN4_9BURK|nr:hypothetical protein [Herbaspirillum rubrisubalbicans]QJQ01546.1 NTPase KAP [Herbaspirillum rubrisubalbicans Os34]